MHFRCVVGHTIASKRTGILEINIKAIVAENFKIFLQTCLFVNKKNFTLPRVGSSVGWSIDLYPKGLRVRSLVRACAGGKGSTFLSHISVFSLSLPFSPKSINMSWIRIKKKILSLTAVPLVQRDSL